MTKKIRRVLATPGEATDEKISATHYPSVTSKSQLESADARSPRLAACVELGLPEELAHALAALTSLRRAFR